MRSIIMETLNAYVVTPLDRNFSFSVCVVQLHFTWCFWSHWCSTMANFSVCIPVFVNLRFQMPLCFPSKHLTTLAGIWLPVSHWGGAQNDGNHITLSPVVVNNTSGSSAGLPSQAISLKPPCCILWTEGMYPTTTSGACHLECDWVVCNAVWLLYYVTIVSKGVHSELSLGLSQVQLTSLSVGRFSAVDVGFECLNGYSVLWISIVTVWGEINATHSCDAVITTDCCLVYLLVP